jgi:hypothetical protein
MIERNFDPLVAAGLTGDAESGLPHLLHVGALSVVCAPQFLHEISAIFEFSVVKNIFKLQRSVY